jgi:hypothetical protein
MRFLRAYQRRRKLLSPWGESLTSGYETKLLQHNRYYCRYFSIKILCRVSTQCLDAFSTIRPIFPFQIFFILFIFGLLKQNSRYILKEARSVFCKEEVKFINQAGTVLTGGYKD